MSLVQSTWGRRLVVDLLLLLYPAMRGLTQICAMLCLSGSMLLAQDSGTARPEAQHPPMGWNSWDAYGLTVTEPEFRANVAVEATKLKLFGWTYAVIDEGWFLENPQNRPTPDKLRYALDPNGRYVPVKARFPSAGEAPEASFRTLATWVHAQGLQFGIHIVRGIPRESVYKNLPIADSTFHAADAADQTDACPWDPTNWGVKDDAAGQAWYDSLMKQYAGWGVDLLKVDCISDHPYKVSEIRMIRRAIDKAGRPMVLSLSPGPTSSAHAAEVGALSNLWRISDDLWDVWSSRGKPFPQGPLDQFARLATWQPYTRLGNWPDADMLPLGELRPSPGDGGPARATRLTHDEQQTMLTLWSMARSPLILGANLTLLDAWTTGLLTNREMIRVDQEATASRQVMRDTSMVAWTADLPTGERALALFNIGEQGLEVAQPLTAFGLPAGRWHVRDVWHATALADNASVRQQIAPHGCVLLLLGR